LLPAGQAHNDVWPQTRTVFGGTTLFGDVFLAFVLPAAMKPKWPHSQPPLNSIWNLLPPRGLALLYAEQWFWRRIR
jgi:hypothetical protein